MVNPSKKTIKKRAYARYFYATMNGDNFLPAPFSFVTNLPEKFGIFYLTPRSKSNAYLEHFLMRQNKNEKRIKSTRQDWKFWYFYY